MGAAAEIMGSRNHERTGSRQKTGTMIYAGDKAATGLPTVRTTFYTTQAGSAESAPLGRLCAEIERDTETFPGTTLFICHFAGPVAYAAGY